MPLTPDERQQEIRKHVAGLMEHFSTVQVFCTYEDAADQTTAAHNHGGGNWYARYGQIQEWMVQQAERAAIQTKRDEDEDAPDA